MYWKQRLHVNTLLDSAKQKYYSDMVREKSKDSKAFYKLIDKLLCRGKVTSLPDCKSRVQLAAEFGSFFVQKIQKIHASLGGGVVSDLSATPAAPDGCVLDELQCATHEEIKKVIMASPTKSCGLDPVPTWLLKNL